MSALAAIEQLSILHKPTILELSNAIDKFASGKTPRNDKIPLDLFKPCQSVFLISIYNHLCCCRAEGDVLQNMNNIKIVTLYKGKGEGSDCNNYKKISLLSIVGKLYPRVLFRLHKLAECVYPEPQCLSGQVVQLLTRSSHWDSFRRNVESKNRNYSSTKTFDTASCEGLY